MKILITTVLVFFLITQAALGLPHLTCDQYVPGPCTIGTVGCDEAGQKVMPTSFILKFDYAKHEDVTTPPRIDALNKVDLWWEIALPDGVYTVRALACIEADKCSDPSQALTFTKAIPVLPILKIVKQGTNIFLTCDPYVPGSGVGIPDDFLIRKDGSPTTITSIAKIDATGKIILWYDVTNLPSGSHTFNVSSRNIWGASTETASFIYQKTSPAKPAIKLQK
jgi:hypothetical protein